MTKTLTILIIFFTTNIFGQTLKTKDTSEIKTRGTGVYYIDGFKVFTKLTKSDSSKILADMVSKLNGCWTSDSTSYIQVFKLSKKSFSGTWYTSRIISTAPLVRLAIINGQIKLINTDIIGGDGSPANISIYQDILTIDWGGTFGIRTYKRQKKCPDKL
jgi:hypothetical protein